MLPYKLLIFAECKLLFPISKVSLGSDYQHNRLLVILVQAGCTKMAKLYSATLFRLQTFNDGKLFMRKIFKEVINRTKQHIR